LRLLARQADTNSTADRIEQAGEDFHRRLREGFLAMAKDEPQRFTVVDSSKELEDVSKNIEEAVLKFL
jgi:dTMP kinase